jgi:glycerophosphoryl diester phosphodiesterase
MAQPPADPDGVDPTVPTRPPRGRVRGRPRVVAHRGASHDVAEHTLGAYRRALADGADALECDVRMTRDGHLVCVHDRRLERTSDGRGVVSTKRLEELESLDWGSWKNPWADLDDEADLPDDSARALLTLRDLLAFVRDQPGPVELLIETKHPTRYSGLVEQRLVELLDQAGLVHPGLGRAGRARTGDQLLAAVAAAHAPVGTLGAAGLGGEPGGPRASTPGPAAADHR